MLSLLSHPSRPMHAGGIAVLVYTLLIAAARAEFGEYIEHDTAGQSLIVQTTEGELRVTALGSDSMVVHYLESGVAQLPSFALAGAPDIAATTVSNRDRDVRFATPSLAAVVHKSPVRISFYRGRELLVEEESGYFAYPTIRGFRFSLTDDEKIIGGGQRVLGMDRRGHRMPLYNRAHYGYGTESNQMYFSLPAVLSSRKYIVVFDNSASGNLDIGRSEPDVLQFDAVSGRTSYLVVAGDSYPSLIDNYTGVTGKQPLPPRWAFGNFASRFGYRTERETRDTVNRFIDEDIPLDAVVLDLYWFGPDIQGHMGRLDWDLSAFPTPKKMIRDFADKGVKTIVITEPFVLSTSGNWDDAADSGALAGGPSGAPRRFEFYFGNTGLIDVFNESAQQWFWKFYRRLFSQGIAGTWGDLGEPEVHPGDTLHWLSDAGVFATGDEIHNAYGHRWAQTVFENQIREYPDKRPFIMMRSGFAGSQRFGMIPWTGDVSRSWDGLKPQVELSLQMGLLGLGYTHSDLGGFAGGEAFDKELYIRWLQYGVFQPVYRPHAQENIAPEPVFHDKETRDIVRELIKLRYRLLPYNYTLAYENSTRGLPLMRPMFFEDESRTELIDIADAYLWGDAFYVTPVVDAGRSAVDVSLPEGVWFDFWSGDRHVGGRDIAYPLTLRKIPVFVRAGSFIPMTESVQSTDHYSSKSLALHYYADETVEHSRGRMYDDDGISRHSIASGQHELLSFSAEQSKDELRIGLSRTAGRYRGMPQRRNVRLIVHNWNTGRPKIRIGGQSVALGPNGVPAGDAGTAHLDPEAGTLTVRFEWDHSAQSVVIR